MNILHICNWAGGVTTRNVAALKRWSRHSHELVVRIDHPYAMATEPAWLTEGNTTKALVLELAAEADVLHFHAVGYDGTPELPDTIHGIDWGQFLGKKRFFLHAMCSYVHPDGRTWTRWPAISAACSPQRFEIRNLGNYDALFGPHLSCKLSYEERLRYVPDIVPIRDWLYTPSPWNRRTVAVTFKNPEVVAACVAAGVPAILLPTPTRLTEQLAWRRAEAFAVFDNATDGHWGLFGIEALAQGIPCVTYVHPENARCWKLLGVPEPPFWHCEYGGKNVPAILGKLGELDGAGWKRLSADCRAWVERYYDPRDLVHYWDLAYDEAF